MWSDVYWTPENVSVFACEIETKKVVEIKKVCTSFFDNYQTRLKRIESKIAR